MSPIPPCHCGDQFNDYQKAEIRDLVCANVPDRYQFLGNHYCILHLPDPEKIDSFKSAFENLLANHNYRFYGTWFPDRIDFGTYRFRRAVDFRYARFNKPVSFEKAVFEQPALFIGCEFHERATFSQVSFLKASDILVTDFYGAIFHHVADFFLAQFHSAVSFQNAQFLRGWSNIVGDGLDTLTFQTTFSNATFTEKADFEGAVFGLANRPDEIDNFSFFECIFEKTATFHKAHFNSSIGFNGSFFRGFVDFRETIKLAGLSFKEVSFESWAKFSGHNGLQESWSTLSTDFSSLIVDKPERMSFQSLRLRPDSFKNTDVRKFDFADVEWVRKRFAFDWSRSKDIHRFWTAEALRRRSDYELLEVIYRRLAVNEEDNGRYARASDFRFTAFEIQRIKNPLGRLPFNLLWWYKWTSRYGENWWWTALLLVALVLLLFPYIYQNSLFSVCTPSPFVAKDVLPECQVRVLDVWESLRQSLSAATFQSVEFRKPFSAWSETWANIEKIAVPVQAALLDFGNPSKVYALKNWGQDLRLPPYAVQLSSMNFLRRLIRIEN